jgi:tRNA pseudouridine55 synthase
MYSALKKEGERLYDLARKGVEVERQPRWVEIPRLELLEFRLPDVVLEAESGRGAYMRSLAHDLGETLGCGGHLASLVRLQAGPFRAQDAVSLDRLRELSQEGDWQSLLQPPDYVLVHLKAIKVGHSAEKLIKNGQPVNLGPQSMYAAHMESYRVYNLQGCFLGVLRLDKARGLWRPYKVFHLDTPSKYAAS